MELIKFISIYSILTLSIIGYGFLFSCYFSKFNNINLSNISIGYIGLFGLFFLTFISYSTNIILAHSNYHNLVIHLIGLLSFLFFLKKNYKKILKNYKDSFFIYFSKKKLKNLFKYLIYIKDSTFESIIVFRIILILN